MSATTITPDVTTATGERADLLDSLAKARHFLRFTARDLTDEQASEQSTVSELTIGGLIKHVTLVERNWASFIVDGADAMGPGKDFDEMTEEDWVEFADSFRLTSTETLAGALDAYAAVAARTDELLRELPSLDAAQALPKAPWFAEGEWSARRVFIHIVSETTQHSGHADIIRESIDGAKSMG
ncbi:DinB family protein [Microlunatus speluncae]|uniref:DinB family protein n=1 Tax=Microlunatus speluncae TaxID=2594267 RepID=UPI0012663BA8|nr:DinB family protein [Microlunatus speluncae]